MKEFLKDLPSRLFLLPVLITLCFIKVILWIHGLLWPRYKDPRRGFVPLFIPIIIGAVLLAVLIKKGIQ